MESSLSDFFSHTNAAIQPPRDWRQMPEVPDAEEFMSNEPPRLPLNDFEARPQLRDQFLETQYRLYRYEATETLRRAIQTLRRARKHQSSPNEQEGSVANKLERVNVYTGVRVVGFALGASTAGQRLIIPNAPVRDEDDDDDVSPDELELFCPGTLLVLSSDCFETTCYVATVLENEGLRDVPPSIDICWGRQYYVVLDPMLNLAMLEPTNAYFESLRHTMVRLQHMSRTSCLLDQYVFSPRPHSVPNAPYLKETPNGNPAIPKTARSLDKSQHDAFTEATTREVSIIQGPPGTGKTFTSNVILQSLVETQRQCREARINPGPKIPVIVSAQTNHALDQLLQIYVETPGAGKVVRLGGRSNNEAIAKLTIHKLRRTHVPVSYRAQPVRKLLSFAGRAMAAFRKAVIPSDDIANAKELFDHNLISEDQYYSITNDDWESNEDGKGDLADWLGKSQPKLEDSGTSRDDKAKQQARWQGSRVFFIPLPTSSDRSASSVSQDRAIHLLDATRNLYNIRPEDRQVVYNYLRERLHAKKHPSMADLIQSYNGARASIQSTKVANDLAYIQADEIDVVGCTVTGLMKYRHLISSLRPQILLMEEAAEVREGDTIAGLLPSIEHLILLGDHQQLQPHVDMVELASDPYRLNISMFERLIKLGIPHKTLLQQRRMIPCLREIVQLFYPKLVDHTPTISKLPLQVSGVSKPLWWFQHDWAEQPGFCNGTSLQNFEEAQMIVLFVQYLVTLGNIPPERITMLTYYRGQVDLLNKQLAANQKLASLEIEWSVRTVDGFQGEENDIILLSLVRGPNGKAGFLSQENRAIVGLSRARVGMYIFGHQEVLLKHPRRTWSKVIRQIGENQGRSLPLRPDPYTDNVVQVDHPDQFKPILRNARHKMPRKERQKGSYSSGSEKGAQPESPGAHNVKSPPKSQAPESKAPESSLSQDAPSPQVRLRFWTANLPSLPPERPVDTTESLASDLELLSFEDSETVPISQQLAWDVTPLQPSTEEAEEQWLIEFSDDEAKEDK
ncbi:helicase-like protein [Metarhizium guizhouense ARSEF 977]|uniref:Helicase-like protein n=1 Tax=Metarhizium guizhouense (strain ARSEF 977) TaxID=1276136 RepID=A0A0B4GVD5_METGA|nr:helicase-like protein [Metarhizium guizhouense ARSEF 977]